MHGELLPTIADAAARGLPWLLDAAAKGAVLLALAALAVAAMRRASAAARHLVWSAALASTLVLPLAAALGPRWLVPVPRTDWAAALLDRGEPEALGAQRSALAAPAPSGAPLADDRAPTVESASTPAAVAAPAAARGRSPAGSDDARRSVAAAAPSAATLPPAAPPSLRFWAALAWAVGALFVLLRLGVGMLGLARLARRAEPAADAEWVVLLQRLSRELGIRRPVTLLVGREGTVPVTWGVVYPVVLLPADASGWSAERRRSVLLHELAHVQRLDAVTHVVSQLALALFWFNPLVVAAARRQRTERERACDDLVLASGARASSYADDLLDIVRTLRAPAPAAAALAMARRSEFEGRLLAILDPALPRARTSRGRALAAATLVLAAAVPLALARPTLAAPPAALAGDSERDLADAAGAPPQLQDGVAAADRRDPAAAPATEPPRLVRLAATVPAPPAPPPAAAPAPAAAAAPGGPQAGVPARRCELVSGQQISAHDDGTRTRTRIADREHCIEVTSAGRVDFTDDDADVRSLAPGGYLFVEETRGSTTRRMELRERGGRIERAYRVNGAERAAAEGTAWLASVLPAVVRESGVGADARVARIRRQRGVPGVIDEVGLMVSNHAKRVYLERLLAADDLTSEELRQVADGARRHLSSDGDKAAVLTRVGERAGNDPRVGSALVSGAASISSDGDRRRVLQTASADPSTSLEVLTRVADDAGRMSSDGDKTAVLLGVAPRIGASQPLRAAFFRSARSIASDGDRRRLLLGALSGGRPAGAPDDATVLGVLEATRGMSSDTDRAAVLAAAAAGNALATPELRTAYFATLDAISSDSDRARLLGGLVRRGVRGDALVAVIRSAARLSSDTDKANVLLEVATRTPALSDSAARPVFFATVKTLSSSSDYRRVMDAVTR